MQGMMGMQDAGEGHDRAHVGLPSVARDSVEVAEGEEAMAETEGEAAAEAKARPKPKTRGERNKELGRRGEDAAVRFLERRGYDIVARNWTCFVGEADIVARDGIAVVFVEVKTRSSVAKGMPAEAVSAAKRARYEKIAATFLADYDVVDVPVRFDVVSVLAIAPDRALIKHHINAFGAA